MINVETLRYLLDYNPETGVLRWKYREGARPTWNTRYSGKEALATDCQGHSYGTILGKRQYAHRVAYAIHYGAWPKGQVDHIDGNKKNNRIENLRDVSVLENARNCPIKRTNTSGVIGVGRHKMSGKWVSYIGVNGKHIHLGLFTRKRDAVAARMAAEKQYDFHENHGRNAERGFSSGR